MAGVQLVTKTLLLLYSLSPGVSQQTSLTALLAVGTPNGPVVSSIWNTNHLFNIGAQIGTRLPILSATGKVFSDFSYNIT